MGYTLRNSISLKDTLINLSKLINNKSNATLSISEKNVSLRLLSRLKTRNTFAILLNV